MLDTAEFAFLFWGAVLVVALLVGCAALAELIATRRIRAKHRKQSLR